MSNCNQPSPVAAGGIGERRIQTRQLCRVNRAHEWRNLTNLIYLLLALVLPYTVNYMIDLTNFVTTHVYAATIQPRPPIHMSTMYYQVAWLHRLIIFDYFKDISNDVYHANNFYMYLLFSTKFRHGVNKYFRSIFSRRPTHV
jgi:hypothetical protein